MSSKAVVSLIGSKVISALKYVIFVALVGIYSIAGCVIFYYSVIQKFV